MRYHYSVGLVGLSVVVLIMDWYLIKGIALVTGYFGLLFTLTAFLFVVGFGFLYIRAFADKIFPELDGVVVEGINAMYDRLINNLEKHRNLPPASRKRFIYPRHINNAHRCIIEYIPRFQHQRKLYVKHYKMIIEELAREDCHYGLVIEQVEALRSLLTLDERD